MSEIANFVLSKMDTTTLLNWDGETSIDDLKENIKSHIKRFSGWTTSVDIYAGQLFVKAKGRGGVITILRYDTTTNREVYGRVKHCGFTERNLQEIRSVTKVAH